MLLSVLTSKGKVPRLNFGPLRSRPWLRGGGPCGGQLPRPGAFVHTQAGSSHHCPGPAEQADLSWQRPRGQVPRLRPAVITEGAWHPGPRRPSGLSFNLERTICKGSTRVHVVANTKQVNAQLATIALL